MKSMPQNQIQEPPLLKAFLGEQGEGLIYNQSLLEVQTKELQIISLQTSCNFLSATIKEDLEKVNHKLSSLNTLESETIDSLKRKEVLKLLKKAFKLQRIFKTFLLKIQAFEENLKSCVNQITASEIQNLNSRYRDLQTEAGVYQEIRFLIGRQILKM
ncbi:MAG: hypothetical protein R2879_10890 [Saprospiraceae bacterium]